LAAVDGVPTNSVNTNWWYLGLAGKLPEFLCPSECIRRLDFIGFDYIVRVAGAIFGRENIV